MSGHLTNQTHGPIWTSFRAIATRYDKTARNFLTAVSLATSVIWLK